MKIYLLRHSESTSNKALLADSQIDAELSDQGQENTLRLVEILKKINPDVFFVSSLKRTLKTIQPFLDTLKEPTVIESPLLIERNLGVFTGSKLGTFKKYCEENNLNRVTFRPEKGESVLDTYNRAVNFYAEIKGNFSDKKVLICSSMVVLMCLEIITKGKEIMDYYQFPRFEPGELREFETK